jgi:hypothetical protein
MTADELRKHINTQPLRTFTIHVADGRRVPVVHRDFILVSPKGRLVDVYQPDDAHDILDVMLITGLEFGPPSPPAGAGQPSSQKS